MKTRLGTNILMGTALVGFLVWQSVQATRFGYEVETSRRRIRALQAHIAALQVEWERSVTPAQLVVKARKRFGMHPAEPESIRVMGPLQQAVSGPS